MSKGIKGGRAIRARSASWLDWGTGAARPLPGGGGHRGTTGRPADLIGPCSSYLDVLLGAGVLRGHGDDGCGSAVGMSALFLLAHLVRSQPAGVWAPSAIELPHMWTLLQGLLGGRGVKS